MHDDLFEFLFPTGLFHSRSTARLYIFAEHGPVLSQGRLRSGYKGQHRVTDQELNDMIEEMIKEDILKIYVGEQVLSIRDQEEVIQQADSKFKNIPNYTRAQIDQVLSECRRNEHGAYNFHDLQRLVRENRQSELSERKKMYPDVVVKTKGRKSVFSQLQQPKAVRKLRDSEMFIGTNRLLSKNACKVTEAESRNNPAVVQNVRILREDNEPSKLDPSFPRWTNIPAGSGFADKVKKHSAWHSAYAEQAPQ